MEKGWKKLLDRLTLLSSINSAEDSWNWSKTCSLTSSGTDGESVHRANALLNGSPEGDCISYHEVYHVQSEVNEEKIAAGNFWFHIVNASKG